MASHLGKCVDCGKERLLADLAPLYREADGTFSESCRKCITTFIDQFFLYYNVQFWMRKEGVDAPL